MTDRIVWTSDMDLRAIQVQVAPIARAKAEDRFHEFRPAGADQSSQAQHLSGIYAE
jgi:hypothetical protein